MHSFELDPHRGAIDLPDRTRNEHFLARIMREDLEQGIYSRPIATRFPPEPNGYLHIGSAFAILTNAGLAERFGGRFNLRFDDTNPLKEDMKYVRAIETDIRWLGLEPEVFFGSDYAERIYESAEYLIRKGKAYVCDLSPEEMNAYRGTLTEPGIDSPYRERSPEQNLDLFRRMRAGEFQAGARVLRAKIDMTSPNPTLRDPALYRIIHAAHYRTGSAWCIYPMYDFAHPIQDAIEGITHSLCSIEFKDHRPLYEWVMRELDIPEAPKQREFGRLNITGVVTSKRYLRELVEGGYVCGWDDPRLPTLMGLRRRGVTPESIRRFIADIGMIRTSSTVDIALLDHAVRQDLKPAARNLMAVLDPIKLIIDNYPEGETEWLEIENNPENESMGRRRVPFGRELYIEREDFMEEPVKGFRRLSPGVEVRLKGAYFVTCMETVKDPATGEITELRCTYDPETKSGSGFDARKVKATLHWVSAKHAVEAEVRHYGALLRPDAKLAESGNDWSSLVDPESRVVRDLARLEPSAASAGPGERFQFVRHGYYAVDPDTELSGKPVFNLIVSLKDNKKPQKPVSG